MVRTLCIIPALNEAGRIERVLDVVIQCSELDEIIVVDNGSTDETVVRSLQYRVTVELCSKRGKGNAVAYAMQKHAQSSDVILLLDADLIGLRIEHILALLAPVKSGVYVQAAGVRDTFLKRLHWRWHIGLTGERAFRAYLLWEVCEIDYMGWALESALNSICRWSPLRRKRQIAKILMHGVTGIDKVEKYPTRLQAYVAKWQLFMEWLLGTLRFILPVRYKTWLS